MSHPKDSTSPTGLTSRRYSSQPFPRYRFVPGENPHPTADPRGHSYLPPGQAHPAVRPVSPTDWSNSAPYLYGVDLYNHGYWWEAHESWESIWQLADKTGPQGRFLQGLIQTAACHLKIHLGKPDGVARLRQTSLDHLRWAAARCPEPVYMGIELGSFIAGLEAYFDACIAGDDSGIRHDSRKYPSIRLALP